MLSLFQRKRVPPTSGTPPTSAIETPKGLTRPESAASLLATPRRQKLLEHIWQRTSLSRRQFATLYLAPLERYAELVQQFPASESHHHAYPGDMLDHGLEIVAYALKLRQSYLLLAGVTPEAQAAQAVCRSKRNQRSRRRRDVPRAEGIEAAPASTAPEIPSCPVAEPEPAPLTVPPPQMSLAPSQGRAEPSGAHFMAWLRQSVQTRKLIINDAKALVHTVAGTTYLVSPGVFQRYAQEYLQVAALAKQEKLGGGGSGCRSASRSWNSTASSRAG